MNFYSKARRAVIHLILIAEKWLTPVFPGLPLLLARTAKRVGGLRRETMGILMDFRASFNRINPVIIDELITKLRELGISSGDTVLLVIDERTLSQAIPVSKTGAILAITFRRRLLERLRALIGEKGTLAIPCDSVSDPKRLSHEGRVYDRLRSRASGLAGMFQRQPGVFRSASPIFSLAAAGQGAEQLVAGHLSASPFPMGAGSPWEKLLLRETKIVILGWGVAPNVSLLVPIHNIYPDYRHPAFFHRPFPYKVLNESGGQEDVLFHIHASPFHPDYDPASYADFKKFSNYLQTKYELYSVGRVGSMDVAVCNYVQQYEVVVREASEGNYIEDARYWGKSNP